MAEKRSKKRENLKALSQRGELPKKEGFKLEKLFDIGTYTSLVEKFTATDENLRKRRDHFFSGKSSLENVIEKRAVDAVKKIKKGDFGKKELRELLELEKKSKKRKTVLAIINEKLLELEGVEDLFNRNANVIIDAVTSGKFDKEELEQLLENEKKNKRRKGVRKALKKEIGKLKSVEDFFEDKVTILLPQIKKGRFSDSELKKLLENELEGKKRKTVIRAIRKQVGPLEKRKERSFKVEVKKEKEEERKVKLESIEIESQEEWRAGIGTHKAEIEKEGEERFVAHILEEEKKESIFEGIVKKLKKIFKFQKKEVDEVKEIDGGLIREGADETARVLEIDMAEDEDNNVTKELAEKKEPEKNDIDDALLKLDFSEAKSELVTGIDKLLFIVKKMERVKLDAAALKLNVTKNRAEEWAKILEDQNLIEMNYPAVGEPTLIEKRESGGVSHEI